jgi:hypothetical protein
LCYSLGNEPLNRCDIRNYNIKDDDTIIFSFGEIDCRCHVHKHINKTTTYQSIIDNIVTKYFEAISLIIEVSKIKLKYVGVYNIVPPVEKYNTPENEYYPYLGTDDERKIYNLYFNEKLKEKCNEKNYLFIDIYDKYIDENGFLRKDCSDGIVHIDNGKFIDEFLVKNDL